MRNTFLKAIEENPYNDTNVLIFADWLEDNDDKEYARVLRWMIRKGKMPHLHENTWHFVSSEYDYNYFPSYCVINNVFFEIKLEHVSRMNWDTWEAATEWLKDAFLAIEEVLS